MEHAMLSLIPRSVWLTIVAALTIIVLYQYVSLIHARVRIEQYQLVEQVAEAAAKNRQAENALKIQFIQKEAEKNNDHYKKARQALARGGDDWRARRNALVQLLHEFGASGDSINPTPLGCLPPAAGYQPPAGCPD